MVIRLRHVPILPTRRGELMALAAVSPEVKSHLTPLFVVTADDDLSRDDRWRPPEQILDNVAGEIAHYWGPGPAFVDVQTFGDKPVPPGVQPLSRLTDAGRERGLALIPVTGLSASGPYRQAVRQVLSRDGRGVCLRVTRREWPFLPSVDGVHRILDDFGVPPTDVDLVLDVAGDAGSGRAPLEISRVLDALPLQGAWRSLVVAGTSYPSPRHIPSNGLIELPRPDWLSYERMVTSGATARPPAFGDYGVTHPDTFVTPPYVVDVRATLRYTAPATWLITRGDLYSTRRSGEGIGADAVPPLARQLLSHPRFDFSQHCSMESWVAQVAHVNSGGGNPTQWHRHATTHHLVLVREQLDRLARTLPARRAHGRA